MSELERLLQELCPNGVEYMPLNAVCNVQNKAAITKDDLLDSGYPVINSSREVLGYYSEYNNEPDTMVLTSHGAYAGFSHYLCERFYAGALCYPMKTSNETVISTKYLYYVFKGLESTIREKYVNKSGVPYINFKALMNHKIPVPPIEVQCKIVRILDNFTELTEELTQELTEELTARKKQYLEYSHALFTQSDCVKKTTLGEIVDICMCKRIMKSQTDTSGEVPFFQNGTLGGEAKLFISNELFREYSQKYKFPNQGDVMLSTVGTIGKTIQYDGEPAYFQDSNIVWLKRKTEDVTNEYLYWFCISMPWKLPERATLKHLHNYMIAETEISIPSKERQAYVIDKFQELESAFKLIDVELLAEIEARQKQYEYYRDKLLTFKELSV